MYPKNLFKNITALSISLVLGLIAGQSQASLITDKHHDGDGYEWVMSEKGSLNLSHDVKAGSGFSHHSNNSTAFHGTEDRISHHPRLHDRVDWTLSREIQESSSAKFELHFPKNLHHGSPVDNDWHNIEFNHGKITERERDDIRSSPVPVPAAFWLLGSGLLGLISLASKRSTV
jgi:hypothetical protein